MTNFKFHLISHLNIWYVDTYDSLKCRLIIAERVINNILISLWVKFIINRSSESLFNYSDT